MARPRRAAFQPRLTDFRHRLGLTQEQVAERVGITAEMVRRHERGIAMPIPLYRKRYCELFKASEHELGFGPALSPLEPISAQAVQAPYIPIQPSAPDFGDDAYLKSVRDHI